MARESLEYNLTVAFKRLYTCYIAYVAAVALEGKPAG